LLSNVTPRTVRPSSNGSATQLCSMRLTPASISISADRYLSHSGSIIGDQVTVSRNAPWRSRQCATGSASVDPQSSWGAPAMASDGRRSSNSCPIPEMTSRPVQSVMRSIQITSPPVDRPPRWL
jgi:hypothetical protein